MAERKTAFLLCLREESSLDGSMRFMVRGVKDGAIVAQSRAMAASAIVLAMKWTENGVQDVAIQSPNGRSSDIEVFRSEHLRFVAGHGNRTS
jgi:hypothetical protein